MTEYGPKFPFTKSQTGVHYDTSIYETEKYDNFNAYQQCYPRVCGHNYIAFITGGMQCSTYVRLAAIRISTRFQVNHKFVHDGGTVDGSDHPDSDMGSLSKTC